MSIISESLTTSIDGLAEVVIIVGSSTVFPSVSFPSSLISVISFVFPGLLAVASTVFEINPVSSAACEITYDALYVAVSANCKIPFAESNEELSKDRPELKSIVLPSPSVRVSTKLNSVKLTLPVFSTVIV